MNEKYKDIKTNSTASTTRYIFAAVGSADIHTNHSARFVVVHTLIAFTVAVHRAVAAHSRAPTVTCNMEHWPKTIQFSPALRHRFFFPSFIYTFANRSQPSQPAAHFNHMSYSICIHTTYMLRSCVCVCVCCRWLNHTTNSMILPILRGRKMNIGNYKIR